jgi:hypothetical protein
VIEIKSAAQIVAMAPVCVAARRADIIFRPLAQIGFGMPPPWVLTSSKTIFDNMIVGQSDFA